MVSIPPITMVILGKVDGIEFTTLVWLSNTVIRGDTLEMMINLNDNFDQNEQKTYGANPQAQSKSGEWSFSCFSWMVIDWRLDYVSVWTCFGSSRNLKTMGNLATSADADAARNFKKVCQTKVWWLIEGKLTPRLWMVQQGCSLHIGWWKVSHVSLGLWTKFCSWCIFNIIIIYIYICVYNIIMGTNVVIISISWKNRVHRLKNNPYLLIIWWPSVGKYSPIARLVDWLIVRG